MRKVIYKIPIFFGKFKIYLIENDKEMDDLIEAENLLTDGKYGGLSFSERDGAGRTNYHLVLRKNEHPSGVIAHECLHLALDLFRHLGIKDITAPIDEFLCYMMEWFMDKTKEFLNRINEK